MKYHFSIPKTLNGVRADSALASLMNISRSSLKKRIKDKLILNGKVKSVSVVCHENDIVEFEMGEPELISLKPQNIPLDIIYEDKHILAVNKQAGLVVHAGGGTKENTLVNALLYHVHDFQEFGDSIRPGIVHRLDKDTSGIILIAKHLSALEKLQKQFSLRSIKKEYRAIVLFNISQDELEINKSIGRHQYERKKMAVGGLKSRDAVTNISVILRFGEYCYINAFPKTGRTHQVRVHLSSIQHPLLGDKVYGSKKCTGEFDEIVKRHMLLFISSSS